MLFGVGYIDRICRNATEHRDSAENVGVGGVGFGVLAEVAAQGADTLTLDADHFDSGLLEPEGNREPGHASRFHDGSDGAVRRRSGAQSDDKIAEAFGRQPEADWFSVRLSVVENARDMIAADGEIDADGTLTHDALRFWLRAKSWVAQPCA